MFGSRGGLGEKQISASPVLGRDCLTLRCGSQGTVGVILLPIGSFVKGILDIVHEVQHCEPGFSGCFMRDYRWVTTFAQSVFEIYASRPVGWLSRRPDRIKLHVMTVLYVYDMFRNFA